MKWLPSFSLSNISSYMKGLFFHHETKFSWSEFCQPYRPIIVPRKEKVVPNYVKYLFVFAASGNTLKAIANDFNNQQLSVLAPEITDETSTLPLLLNLEKVLNYKGVASPTDDLDNIKTPSLMPLATIKNVDLVQYAIHRYTELSMGSVFGQDFELPNFIDGTDVEVIKNPCKRPVLLGEGSFGAVFLGRYNGNLVAIKCTKKSFQLRAFINEVTCMEKMNTSNCSPVVHGITFVRQVEYGPLAIVMEFVGNETTMKSLNLKSHIQQCTKVPYSNNQWLELCSKIIQCMKSLKENGICTNDVKSDNFVYHAGKVYVIDYGLASAMGKEAPYLFSKVEKAKIKEALDQHRQMAPELFLTDKTEETSDIYGCGYVLGKIKIAMKNDLLKPLVDKCRQENPVERPTVEEMESFVTELKSHET